MPSNSSVLALFSPKPPVEPTEPKTERRSEADFNDFLSNATHHVERAQKPKQVSSTKNNKRDEIGNREKIKPKIKNGKEKPVVAQDKPVIKEKLKTKGNEYAETATKIGNTTVTKTETTSTDSVLKQNIALASKLKELGIKQDEFEALLEYLGFNGEVGFESILQALIQNLNQNSFTGGKDTDSLSQSELLAQLQKNEGEKTNITQSELLAQLQKNEGEAIHALKKAGLTGDQAKNLIDQLKTTSTNTNSITAQREADKTLELNIKKDIQPQQIESAKNESTKQIEPSELFKNTGRQKKGNEPEVYIRPKDVSQKIEKSDRTASLDKLTEATKTDEATNKISSELKGNQGSKTSNSFNQILQDNNGQAKVVQTDGGKDTGNFKGFESAKSGPDLQVQVSNSAAENAIKATQANKSALPEKLVARGTSETKIISQIINKLNVRTTGAQNEVHVKLDPPSLGTVRLNITTVGESVRTVIVAENQAVKQTIESNFNQLRDAMNDQGLKVDSFSVTVGGESGNSNQNGKQLGEKGTANHLHEPQTAASVNGVDLEEVHVPFIFDENQSISVLA